MITLLVISQQALLIRSWIFGFSVIFLICLSQFISIFHMLLLFFLHRYRTSPFHVLPCWLCKPVCKLVIGTLVRVHPVVLFVLGSQFCSLRLRQILRSPCPLCIFLSRFISDVPTQLIECETQLVKCESKVILNLGFNWLPSCLRTCLSAFITEALECLRNGPGRGCSVEEIQVLGIALIWAKHQPGVCITHGIDLVISTWAYSLLYQTSTNLKSHFFHIHVNIYISSQHMWETRGNTYQWSFYFTHLWEWVKCGNLCRGKF